MMNLHEESSPVALDEVEAGTAEIESNTSDFDRTIPSGAPVLSGSKEGLSFSVHHGIDAPFEDLRDHAVLLAHMKQTYPAEVKEVRFSELREGDYLITSVRSSSGLEARMHAERMHEQEGTRLGFGGMASYGNVSDVARAMIAATIVAEEHRSGKFPSGEAIARHYKSTNDLNLGSTLPFSRMGFHGTWTGPKPVSFDDIHMLDEWQFIEGVPHVGSHLMRGKAKDIGPPAWDQLSDWKLTFGNSRKEEENTFFFAAKEPFDD